MLTEIIVVLDRSGSMASVKDDTIGGFNQFLEDQQNAEGSAKITLTQFDGNYDIIYQGVDINEAPKLTEENYRPGGMTALLDAVGRTIDEVGRRLKDTHVKMRPDKVLFVIQTDGHENSSREYNRKQIIEKIKHQTEKYQWSFVFLGANQDAIASGQSIGVAAGNSLSYQSRDMKGTMNKLSTATRSYRSGVGGQSVSNFWEGE